VGVKDSLEANAGEDQGADVHACVQDLDENFAVISEHSVRQNAWEGFVKIIIQHQMSKFHNKNTINKYRGVDA